MPEKKILIVEDNAIVALETNERLKKLGYIVTGVAATGANAIELARKTRPDLILMDINLKGEMDGITAAGEIAGFLDSPVIYLTAYSDDETLQRAMKTKPVAYLIKPFRERELYSNIEMALYRNKAEKETKKSGETDEMIQAVKDLKEGVMVLDSDERILFMNRAASMLTGFSGEEVTGSPISSVFKIKRGDPALEAILKEKAAGFPLLQEKRIPVVLVTRSGAQVPVTAETIPILNKEGGSEGAALVFWKPDAGS